MKGKKQSVTIGAKRKRGNNGFANGIPKNSKMCNITVTEKNIRNKTGRYLQKEKKTKGKYVKNEYKNGKKTKKHSNKYSLSFVDVI